jgi:membrane protein DedA with SNARE-associated domain
MSEQLLSLVTQYGPPALFGIVGIAAIGVPLPITLLLIVVGSMVSQGAMNIWLALAAASAGSILGDQAGYAIGRFGGTAAVEKLSRVFGKKAGLEAMEAKAHAWGGPGIFLTRWLLSALGPWINLASGTAAYPWHRFLFWDILGECTGAAIYISLGRIFSDRVLALDSVLGDMTWAIGALILALILGWQLWKRLRR